MAGVCVWGGGEEGREREGERENERENERETVRQTDRQGETGGGKEEEERRKKRGWIYLYICLRQTTNQNDIGLDSGGSQLKIERYT